MSDLATFLLFALVGGATFAGICVGGYMIQKSLRNAGYWIEERTRLSQIHFLSGGLVLALVAIVVQYTVGWTSFVVLAAAAVFVSALGNRPLINIED